LILVPPLTVLVSVAAFYFGLGSQALYLLKCLPVSPGRRSPQTADPRYRATVSSTVSNSWSCPAGSSSLTG